MLGLHSKIFVDKEGVTVLCVMTKRTLCQSKRRVWHHGSDEKHIIETIEGLDLLNVHMVHVAGDM